MEYKNIRHFEVVNTVHKAPTTKSLLIIFPSNVSSSQRTFSISFDMTEIFIHCISSVFCNLSFI